MSSASHLGHTSTQVPASHTAAVNYISDDETLLALSSPLHIHIHLYISLHKLTSVRVNSTRDTPKTEPPKTAVPVHYDAVRVEVDLL